MSKVLIEFFDNDYLENIVPVLADSYDKIIYLFSKSIDGKDALKNKSIITEFILRKTGVTPGFVEVDKIDSKVIISELEKLTDTENEFIFDISGGSNIFIYSVGIFVQTYPFVDATVIQYDIGSGKLLYCSKKSGDNILNANINLSVEEILKLHDSGVILHDNIKIRYNLKKNNLCKEIQRLWDAVKNISKDWNSFNAMTHNVFETSDGLLKFTDKVDLKNSKSYNRVVNVLENKGIIFDVGNYADTTSFFLDVPENARFLYQKGGNVLEMYCYSAAKECGAFTDIATGVEVDWDGEIKGVTEETTNEVDLLLVSGYIPVFVSCKNTVVQNNHLYEVNALVRHYCGKYAKKVLISTLPATVAIKNRAKDMDIVLIDNVNVISFNNLKSKLAAIVEKYI